MDRIDRAAEQALQHAKAYRRGGGPRWRVPSNAEIRAIRKNLLMTQRQFAARFGFDLDTVKSWELGRRTPDQSNCLLLALIKSNPDAMGNMIQRISIEEATMSVFSRPHQDVSVRDKLVCVP